MKKNGLIHIYTGDGKGKTTSAVGLAVRALGHGFKVCYSFFHKNPDKYGYAEIKNIEKLGAKVIGFAYEHPLCNAGADNNVLLLKVNEGIEILKQMIKNEKFDMLILDEIIISVRDGFLKEEILIDFMNMKPQNLELILTGRGASQTIIDKADYVSIIYKAKHPFDNNIKGREGIEY